MNVTNGEWFQSCCRKVAPYICQKDPKPNTSGREVNKLFTNAANYDNF